MSPMLRVHVDEPLAATEGLDLPPGAARHVQVRRLQPGDELRLFDGRGGEWSARVLAMGRQSVRVSVLRHLAVATDPSRAVTLAVGMPANDRMDWLVEKATELGVSAIQPLQCARSVLRLDGERASRKVAHWQALAVAAAEQCGRSRVPRLAPVRRLDEWLASGEPQAVAARWLLDPGAAPAPVGVPAGEQLVLSGPEGGLDETERASAQAAGFRALSLGPRVLRAETAPLAALVRLQPDGEP